MILPLHEPFRAAKVRIPTQYEMVHHYFELRDTNSRVLGWRIRCNRLFSLRNCSPPHLEGVRFTTVNLTYKEFLTYLFAVPGPQLVSSRFEDSDPKTLENILVFHNTEKGFSYGQSLCLALNLLPENEFPQDSKK
jgi:hypothetical protein